MSNADEVLRLTDDERDSKAYKFGVFLGWAGILLLSVVVLCPLIWVVVHSLRWAIR